MSKHRRGSRDLRVNGNCETIARFRTWGEAGTRGCGQDGARSQNMPSGWVSGHWSLASGLERGVKWGPEVGAGHSEVSENAPGVGSGDWSLAWSTASRPRGDCLGQRFSEQGP